MKWISWITLLLLLSMIISQLQRGGPPLDQIAPAIQAPLLQGGTFDLQEHKGQVLVLDFWATWCPPCRATLPALAEVYQSYKDDPQVQVLTVNSERISDKALKRFLRRSKLQLPVIRDVRQVIKSQYSIRALPTLVVIAPNGRVSYTKVGASSTHVPTLVIQLKELIESTRNSHQEQML